MIQVDPGLLYEQRLVILIEKAPQTNRYEQVIITPVQLELLKPCIGTRMPDNFKTHDGKPMYNLQTDSAGSYELPDSIRTFR